MFSVVSVCLFSDLSVCLSVHREGSHVIIIHDALDLTIQGHFSHLPPPVQGQGVCIGRAFTLIGFMLSASAAQMQHIC